ncbi:hypothetical protein ACFOYW_18330 [Gryllotalpicola reticulitermitis]|uniref:Uncharacterized protein n=1 Tax=Gryllotalpicola reticulitermitis TaxID=1184153 RepID=A0ABV8QD14_9MICO
MADFQHFVEGVPWYVSSGVVIAAMLIILVPVVIIGTLFARINDLRYDLAALSRRQTTAGEKSDKLAKRLGQIDKRVDGVSGAVSAQTKFDGELVDLLAEMVDGERKATAVDIALAYAANERLREYK